MGTTRVDVVRTSELGVPEQDAWRGFTAGDPALAHPYFDLRYALIAGEFAPQAFVAVVHRGGSVHGFLPFQRRGGALQPLGAPLTDYHGVIAAPGAGIDLERLVDRLGGRLFRFNGLTSAEPDPRWIGRPSMIADLSGGWEAWLEGRRAARPGVFKNLRRAERALTRDLGPIRFTLGEAEPEVLDHILKRKREQLARTGWPDIFACGWTEALLRRLLERPDADFGARLAVLRAGDRVVSAEIGLHGLGHDGAGVRHLWFPVYEPDLGRYAPGMLMTLKTLEACAATGVTRVDFGAGAESYKAVFADPGALVYEGSVAGVPWRAAASRLLDTAVGAAPARLGRLRTAVNRRLDVATACEPRLDRRMGVLARLKMKAGHAAAALSLLPVGL